MLKKRTRLTVGVAVVLILGGLSISKYQAMILKSREATLKENLTAMRDVIKQYSKDKQKAPQSLQGLVAAGYFRELPLDPIANSNSNWQPVVGDVVISAEKTDRGIADVHSESSAISSDGTTYNAW